VWRQASVQQLSSKHNQLQKNYDDDMGRHEAEVARRVAEVEERHRERIEELQSAVVATEESAQQQIDLLSEEKDKLVGDQSVGIQQSSAMLQSLRNDTLATHASLEQERQALVEMREAGQEREIRLEKEKMELAQALTETQRLLDDKSRELEKLEGQTIGTEAEDYTLKSELYEKELALEVHRLPHCVCFSCVTLVSPGGDAAHCTRASPARGGAGLQDGCHEGNGG